MLICRGKSLSTLKNDEKFTFDFKFHIGFEVAPLETMELVILHQIPSESESF